VGVECRAVSGFGILIPQEKIEAALNKLGIEWNHDEPYLELSDHYGLPEPDRIGSCYSGKIDYLFFAKQVRDPDTGSTVSNPEQVAALKRMNEECGFEQKPAFHEGELWY
jgi:hypothetical protein